MIADLAFLPGVTILAGLRGQVVPVRVEPHAHVLEPPGIEAQVEVCGIVQKRNFVLRGHLECLFCQFVDVDVALTFDLSQEFDVVQDEATHALEPSRVCGVLIGSVGALVLVGTNFAIDDLLICDAKRLHALESLILEELLDECVHLVLEALVCGDEGAYEEQACLGDVRVLERTPLADASMVEVSIARYE